jgi:hypothetical protein
MALGARLLEEARRYALLSLYFFVCFAAILSYKSALLAEEGIAFSPLAFAAIKAIVLAKFLLLGSAAGLGEGLRRGHLARATLFRSLLFAAFLVVLLLAEESIVGLMHGRAVGETLTEMVSGRSDELAATVTLIWLVLLPYLAVQEIRARLGEEGWRTLLAGRSLRA